MLPLVGAAAAEIWSCRAQLRKYNQVESVPVLCDPFMWNSTEAVHYFMLVFVNGKRMGGSIMIIQGKDGWPMVMYGSINFNHRIPLFSIIYGGLTYSTLFQICPKNVWTLTTFEDFLTVSLLKLPFFIIYISKFVSVIKQSRYAWTSCCDFRSRFIKFY